MNSSLQLCVGCFHDGQASNATKNAETINTLKPLISASVFNQIVIIMSSVLIFTSVIGLASNFLVLATFWKLGFSESINVSYFALGVSDIGVLGTTLWGAILNLFEFLDVDLPFNALSMSSPSMHWPGEGFEKTTSSITAYIALERCLCVLFPLHVKRFLSRRKTTVIVTTIFVLVCGPSNLAYFYFEFYWAFDPYKNKTVLDSDISRNPTLQLLLQMLEVYLKSVIHFTALVCMWICSAFLAVTLKRNVKKREANFGQDSKFNVSQARNRRVIKTVLLIATAYLAFSTPKVIINIITTIYRGYLGTSGVYFRSYMTSIIAGVQLSLLNSSVNVFIYLYTSSKFRETIQALVCKQSSKTKVG